MLYPLLDFSPRCHVCGSLKFLTGQFSPKLLSEAWGRCVNPYTIDFTNGHRFSLRRIPAEDLLELRNAKLNSGCWGSVKRRGDAISWLQVIFCSMDCLTVIWLALHMMQRLCQKTPRFQTQSVQRQLMNADFSSFNSV